MCFITSGYIVVKASSAHNFMRLVSLCVTFLRMIVAVSFSRLEMVSLFIYPDVYRESINRDIVCNLWRRHHLQFGFLYIFAIPLFDGRFSSSYFAWQFCAYFVVSNLLTMDLSTELYYTHNYSYLCVSRKDCRAGQK